jgi:hypothetical protein
MRFIALENMTNVIESFLQTPAQQCTPHPVLQYNDLQLRKVIANKCWRETDRESKHTQYDKNYLSIC